MAELGFFGKSFVSAVAKQNCTQLNEMGLVYENDDNHIKSLYKFLEEQGIARESLDEEQLDGMYAIIGTATRGELTAAGRDKVVCIINTKNSEKTKSESGHYTGLAVATLGEDGKVNSEIMMDPKILKEYYQEYEKQFGTRSGERYPVRSIKDFAEFASNNKTKFLSKSREDFVKVFGEQEVQDRENLGVQDQKNGSPNAVGIAPPDKMMDKDEQNDFQVRYERGKAICKAAGMDVESIEKGGEASFNFANVTGALKINDTTELNKKLPGQKLVDGASGIAVQCIDTGDDTTKAYTNYIFLGDSTVPTKDDSNDAYLNEEFDKKRGSSKSVEEESSEDNKKDLTIAEDSNMEKSIDVDTSDPQMISYLKAKMDEIIESMRDEVASAVQHGDQPHVVQEKLGDAYGNAYGALEKLQQETGVDISEVNDGIRAEAEEHYSDAQKAELVGFVFGDRAEEIISGGEATEELEHTIGPNQIRPY